MERFFHFGVFQCSLVFGALALIGLLVCLCVVYLGMKKVDDRRVAATGYLLLTISLVLFLVIFPEGHYGQNHLMALFFVSLSLYVVGHTVLVLSNMAIYSKLVSVDCMGFAMGVKRAIDISAMILGPLWAGGLVGSNLRLQLGVNLGLCLFSLTLFALSYRRMVRS